MNLPVELITDILEYVIGDLTHPRTIDVLRVNSLFYIIAGQALYSDLKFFTSRQLRCFAEQTSPVGWKPRTLLVQLSGGTADFDVFKHLASALQRCGARRPDPSTNDTGAQVRLERLSLCMHSHTINPHLRYIFDALSLANPRVFEWKGPDPDHHFSIAIVPTATYHIFKAVGTWSAIEHITLTNLAFPPEYLGIPLPSAPPKPLLPPLSSLRTIYLGKATLVNPNSIAAMICLPGLDKLESIRLVDAYLESIWGPRIRRSDLERAALSLQIDMPFDARIARIRTIVRCEALTERIVGGDRVEGISTLD